MLKVFRRFILYLYPYRLHIVLVLVCSGLFVIFSASAYWLSASFLQTLFTGGLAEAPRPDSLYNINDWLKYHTARLLGGPTPVSTLARAALAIVIAFLGKNIFLYLQLFYVSFVEQRVIKDLRDELFAHLLRQDLGFFHSRRRGHLMSTVLADVEALNQALNKSFTKIIRDPLNAIVLLILLVTVSPKLTLVAAILVPTVGWTVHLLGKRVKVQAGRVQEALARVTGHLQESVGGIRVVKAFSGEIFERDRFHRRTTDHYRSSFRRERMKRLVIPLNEFVGVLIISGLLYIGGDMVLVRQSMGSEDFIRFLVLLFALLDPILSLSNLMTNVRVAEAAGGRVFELLDTSPVLQLRSGSKIPGEFRDSIRFDRVCFRYAEGLPFVLKNIDLEIRKGEHLAIVGRSGSGKSTLLNLLPRFYDPVEGWILLDGVDIREFDLLALRKLFGVVTQQVILFHDTVRSNIAYGDPDAGFDDVVRAAQSAFADDFIRALPNGYETVIGEEGSLLSGGQRQRISIARAFLHDPPIVLLDEATSALDPESADQVTGALERLAKGRTVVNVTHRLAATTDADRIILLDQGKIQCEGKHTELLEECPLYRTLAKQQKLLNIQR